MAIKRRGVEGAAFAEQWRIRLRRWQAVRDELLFPQLADLMPRTSHSSACDVGCGEGSTTRALLAVVPASCTVTAIDVNQTLLEACKKSSGERVQSALVDLRKPVKLGKTFDLLLCCNVLMFLDDSAVGTAVNWFRTHLSMAGVLIVSIVHPCWTLAANRDPLPESLPESAEFPVGWDSVDAMLYYRTIEWYSRTFSKYGFTVERDTIISLPERAERFGNRFRGKDGWPVYWVAKTSLL